MGGSQLKQLKAALKANGLTGQTNVKHKGKHGRKTPNETRRDDRAEVIQKIREQFNPFDVKVTKKRKNEIDTRAIKGAQGKPGISKQIGEEQRKAAWEAKKKASKKVGGLKDRRFGENDSTLTPEEKMLERFTREKQVQSSKNKNGLYSLDNDSDDNDGEFEGLTHYGKSLSLKDDFEETDLGNDEDEFMKPKKRSLDEAEEEEVLDQDGVPRKKTKAEVMKEVIAKSKFYKQQRQLVQEKVEDQINELDEDYANVLQELGSVARPKKEAVVQANQSNGLNYEKTLRELNLDRRAVPADRTKTQEELIKEKADKMKELEEARKRRMEGLVDEDDGERGPDELGNDDYWVKDSEDDVDLNSDGEAESNAESDAEAGQQDGEDGFVVEKPKSTEQIPCPANHDELLTYLEDYQFEDEVEAISKILKTYSPRLQSGNKERLAQFSVILFQHILYNSETELIDDINFTKVQESLIQLLKKCTEKFNMAIVEFLRGKFQEMQERINETLLGQDEFPRISDLTLFAIIGVLYSTSDHYNLVVTPSSILMGEYLEQLKFKSLNSLIGGVFISQVFTKYQRLSKRFIPEVVYFLEKALLSFTPPELESNIDITASADFRIKLPNNFKQVSDTSLRISNLDTEFSNKNELRYQILVLQQLVNVVDSCLDQWKEKTAFIEIAKPFVIILQSLSQEYPDFKPVGNLLTKFNRLLKFAVDERKPLTLQVHKKLAIKTYEPQFEENFNPEKKSYDENRARQEINKMRKQIKQERKITMREIRKDTRFEARQQIKEKKESYDQYHAKMARIMNSINTIEGAEKNAYAREQKQRQRK